MADSTVDSGPAEAGSALTIDFERGIPFLVSALGAKLADMASRDVRKVLGIGLMEWRTVALLAVETQATPARVGKVAGVDKSVVSRAAATLEQRGMIEVESDPPGSRQTRLSLTAKGRELHDRGVRVSFERSEALLKGFSAEERELLTDFLKRAIANLPGLESAPKA